VLEGRKVKEINNEIKKSILLNEDSSGRHLKRIETYETSRCSSQETIQAGEEECMKEVLKDPKIGRDRRKRSKRKHDSQ
jgi:hypothetical protein